MKITDVRKENVHEWVIEVAQVYGLEGREWPLLRRFRWDDEAKETVRVAMSVVEARYDLYYWTHASQNMGPESRRTDMLITQLNKKKDDATATLSDASDKLPYEVFHALITAPLSKKPAEKLVFSEVVEEDVDAESLEFIYNALPLDNKEAGDSKFPGDDFLIDVYSYRMARQDLENDVFDETIYVHPQEIVDAIEAKYGYEQPIVDLDQRLQELLGGPKLD